MKVLKGNKSLYNPFYFNDQKMDWHVFFHLTAKDLKTHEDLQEDLCTFLIRSSFYLSSYWHLIVAIFYACVVFIQLQLAFIFILNIL